MKYKVYPPYIRQGFSTFNIVGLCNSITPSFVIQTEYWIDDDTKAKLTDALVEAAEKVMKEMNNEP